ncbi:hypothetical protein LSAT2_020099 [Lamellibrachia satsuma]|nr:hypothetical protein LSAT2_020099 [Lamellibrachia satsuma]
MQSLQPLETQINPYGSQNPLPLKGMLTIEVYHKNKSSINFDRRGCRLNVKKNGLNFVEACLCVLVTLVLSCQLTEPDL